MIESRRTPVRTNDVYTNYRLQLADREVLGTLVVRDGVIASIDEGVVAEGIDGGGAILMPGLVELHTDNLEKCMMPRPGVSWPLDAAAQYHDRDMIGAGITTVCDAIAIGDVTGGSSRMTHFGSMIETIVEGASRGRYAADHRIHVRCELVYSELVGIVERYLDLPALALVSVMDHTPGQRQFVDLAKFQTYYSGKHGIAMSEMPAFMERRRRDQATWSDRNRHAIVAAARARGIALATHDDGTLEHVEEAVRDGAAIAEFPTTMEAARAAHARGLAVLMGAPNLVLGGSHSGNVSAVDLVRAGLVDIISSDYVPQSLLQSAFLIARDLDVPLHEAMRSVTSSPARAIGLDDRGDLAVGKRADLVMVDDGEGVPRILGVVVAGERVG